MNVPLTWEDFHLVNAGVTVYAIAAAAVGWQAPAFALSSAALVTLNAAAFHLGSTLITGQYSPGTATAMLLFVPVGIHAYVSAHRDGVLTRRVLILSAGGGLFWHAFLATVFYFKYFV